MRKGKKISLALTLILCTNILLSGSVLALSSNSSCPHCKYSISETKKIENVGNMIVTPCTHGFVRQKDVIQNTKITTTYQCNRCAWFEDQISSSSYLVGHLLYTD